MGRLVVQGRQAGQLRFMATLGGLELHARSGMDGWTEGWTDGRMDGWMEGRMDGRWGSRAEHGVHPPMHRGSIVVAGWMDGGCGA